MAEEAKPDESESKEPEIKINSVPDITDTKYKVVKSIPVDISYEEGVKEHIAYVSQSVEDLPNLFVCGQGKTPEAARDDLAGLVLVAFIDMRSRKDELESNEKMLYEGMCEYIQPAE